MADNSFKVKNSLNIQPVAGASPTAEGDVVFDSTADALKVHNGTAVATVVTEVAGEVNPPTDQTHTLGSTGLMWDKVWTPEVTSDSDLRVTAGPAGRFEFYTDGQLNIGRILTSADTPNAETVITAEGNPLLAALLVRGPNTSESGSDTDPALAVYVNYAAGTTAIQGSNNVHDGSSVTTIHLQPNGGDLKMGSGSLVFPDADGLPNQVLKTDGSGILSWGAAAAGTNYISAANDGSAIGSWVTYDDGASSTPVNGTGGSPGITYAVSTNSDLRGSTNFLFTHDAADRQGEGFSYDFTIDAADKYSVLQCSFDYLVASGTYADDDLQFWIYDVTNAALIQPAPYKLKNASIAQKFAFEFQATSSTSYRLIGHVATSTATAYTIRFDNWNLGPQAKLYGSPITDWVSYTPTGSWTANSPVYSGKWRRVGDSMEVQALVSCGGAATAASLTFNLPSGYSIDTSKLLSTSADQGVLGTGEVLDSGTQNYSPVNVVYSSTTAVGVYMTKTDGTYAVGTPVNATVPITFGLNDSVAISFKVPISGWSSSVIMSSDAATNVVAARYSTNAGQSISNGSTAIIDFEDKDFDTNGAVTTGASWKFTAPIPGKYRVVSTIRYSNASSLTANTSLTLQLFKNGSLHQYIALHTVPVTASYGYNVTGSGIIDLIAGDYIDLRTDHGEGTARALQATGTLNHVAIERISGPAQIAASETVAARYSTAAGQSISNNSDTIVDFGTKDFDYMGSVTTGGSWKFVAPISGLYAVSGFIEFTNGGGWGVGEEAYAVLYKGGVSQFRLSGYVVQAAHATYVPLPFATSEVRLLAGEYIDIRAYQNSGASLSLLSSGVTNWVSVKRVGNY